MNIAKIFKEYKTNIEDNLDDKILSKILNLSEAIFSCWKRHNTIFLAGNGGSASNAIHLANDLTFGAGKTNGVGISSDALCSNQAVITCLANDIGYENIFAEQLKVKAKKNDILILYSGSGNSKNIINAVNQAKKSRIDVYGLVGFDGGALAKMIEPSKIIHFNIDDMQVVEDLMMIINHIIIKWLSHKSL